MKKTYKFTLYDNNEKDRVLIKILEMLPSSLRGRFIRNKLLGTIEQSLLENFRNELIKEGQEEIKIKEVKEKTEKNTIKNNPFTGLKI
jgi:activator of HSP90 ATPase